MEWKVQLVIFFTLLFLGYGFGRYNEKRHFRSIKMREFAYRHITCLTIKSAPTDFRGQATLVSGSVVISIDYFKKIAAAIKGLLGGRLVAYESLLERARREALLRMQQEAKSLGASTVINIKLETASISKSTDSGVGAVEVIAYGTALCSKDDFKPDMAVVTMAGTTI